MTDIAFGYMTRAHRNQLVKISITAHLTTANGAKDSNAEIARAVGCGPKMVSAIRNDLAQLGLLGRVNQTPTALNRIPEASFDVLAGRIADAKDGLRELCHAGAESEITEPLARKIGTYHTLLSTEGAMPSFYEPLCQKLDEIEDEIENEMEWRHHRGAAELASGHH